MSSKKEITCDKCGKKIPEWCAKYYSARMRLWSVNENRTTYGQRIDLCDSCFELFIEFLESGI